MKFKKVWAVYFSATGTTKKTVTSIANYLAEKLGVEREDYDFTLPKTRTGGLRFSSDDLVVFGTWVVGGRVPNVILKYLATIEGNDAIAVPVTVYGNRAYEDSLIELRDILEKQGFHTVAGATFIGEHSFSKTLAKGRPDAEDLEIARDFALKIADKVEKITDSSTLTPVHVEGVPFPYRGYYQPHDNDGNPIDIRKIKPKTSDVCNDCKICVDLCPMGSINEDDVREFNGICIKCGACIKMCPLEARYFDEEGYVIHKKQLEDGLTDRKIPETFL